MIKVTATNINDLVDQINQNFSILLTSPIFKGLQGNGGQPGSSGGPGMRGSLWTVIDLATLNSNFGTTHTAQSLDESVLQNLVTTDLAQFISSTTLSNFAIDDLIIAPDGKVYRWNGTNVEFAHIELVTPNQAVSYQTVLTLIQQNTVNAGSSLLKEFNVSHKKYKDSSANAALNASTVFPDSVLDFDILGSTPGTVNAGIRAIGYKESVASSTDLSTQYKNVSVSGHVKELYAMVQSVLVNTVGETVDIVGQMKPDYVPSHVMLQNDYSTGMSIGHRAETSMKKFGQLWMTAANVLNLSANHADDVHKFLLQLGVDVSGSKYSSLLGENVRLKTYGTGGKVVLDKSDLTIPAGTKRVIVINSNKEIEFQQELIFTVPGSPPVNLQGSANNYTFVTTNVLENYINGNYRRKAASTVINFYNEVVGPGGGAPGTYNGYAVKDDEGFIHMYGVGYAEDTPHGKSLGNLPSGWRPTTAIHFPVACKPSGLDQVNMGYITIATNGNVTLNVAPGANYVDLIEFNQIVPWRPLI